MKLEYADISHERHIRSDVLADVLRAQEQLVQGTVPMCEECHVRTATVLSDHRFRWCKTCGDVERAMLADQQRQQLKTW